MKCSAVASDMAKVQEKGTSRTEVPFSCTFAILFDILYSLDQLRLDLP